MWSLTKQSGMAARVEKVRRILEDTKPEAVYFTEPTDSGEQS